MDISEYNRRAWDAQVSKGSRWTVPVSRDVIASAREGEWSVVLTPNKPVPANWFPNFNGLDVLGLASAGGQQSPIFAAAGARVTVLDNSARQLEQDQIVAQREGLQIATVLGDMRDLSAFQSESFDLVFNPCSVSFIPAVQEMFDEAYRVLRPGGWMMCGFINQLRFIFDEDKVKVGELVVRHRLPYADDTHLTPSELEQLRVDGEPFMFSHSLENLIAGQLRSGFILHDLFEDRDEEDKLSAYLPSYFATLAQRRWPQAR